MWHLWSSTFIKQYESHFIGKPRAVVFCSKSLLLQFNFNLCVLCIDFVVGFFHKTTSPQMRDTCSGFTQACFILMYIFIFRCLRSMHHCFVLLNLLCFQKVISQLYAFIISCIWDLDCMCLYFVLCVKGFLSESQIAIVWVDIVIFDFVVPISCVCFDYITSVMHSYHRA